MIEVIYHPWPFPTMHSKRIEYLYNCINTMKQWKPIAHGKNPCTPEFAAYLDKRIERMKAEIWETIYNKKFMQS